MALRPAVKWRNIPQRRLRVKRTTLYWLIPLFIILLGLAACERPVQDSVLPATATPGAPLLATLPPSTGASPTPLPLATVDPNAPAAASATPTIDPAAQPVATSEASTPPPPEPTAAPTQQTNAAGEIIHVVQAGENLYRIALRYGTTYQELAAYNVITNPNALSIGQEIRIPPTP